MKTVLCYFLFTTFTIAYNGKQLQIKILQKQSRQILKFLDKLESSFNHTSESCLSTSHDPAFSNCGEIQNAGFQQESGVYIIRLLHEFKSLPIYCDMTTVGEFSGNKGWISVQRRQDGTVSFDHGWQNYLNGFGFPDGEHWIGLQNIHSIVRQRRRIAYYYYKSAKAPYGINPIIRVQLEDWDGMSLHAEHDQFYVTSEHDNYEISSLGSMSEVVDGYGKPVDGYAEPVRGLMYRPFGTHDHDPGAGRRIFKDCVKSQTGGWWFGDCPSNLNGRYPAEGENNTRTIMYTWFWKRINPKNTPLRYVSMMLQWVKF